MHIVNNNIYIGQGLLQNAALLQRICDAQRLLVVTDHTVSRLFLTTLQQSLGRPLDIVTLEPNEEFKTWAAVETILAALAKQHDRTSQLLALGGGVVGDLSAFAASIFMRGMSLIHIPTTLLAQVDAAIGGKTGCNLFGVKNLIGTFYNAQAVVMDVTTLNTLPTRQYVAGLAEVIKYGMAVDATFFAELEANKELIRKQDPAALTTLVGRCCELKLSIVQADPYDNGQRMVLNFGHTFGHAIEAATGFNKYLHGEAVALGMLLASRLAVKLKLLPQDVYVRLVNLLRYFGLPLQVDWSCCNYGELLNYLMHDKKKRAGKLNLILPCALGKAVVVPDVVFADVEDFIRLCLRDSMIVIGDNV